MVSFSCRISPLTLTVIFFDRSPRAIAVDTSAILRTCAVRLPAMKFTESVKSFHVPATPGTLAWPPRELVDFVFPDDEKRRRFKTFAKRAYLEPNYIRRSTTKKSA